MDMIKDSDVLRCMSKQLERPYVSPEQLMSVTPEIIALIPKEFAEEFSIVPVSLVFWLGHHLGLLDRIPKISGNGIRSRKTASK